MKIVMQKTHDLGLMVLDEDIYSKLPNNFIAETKDKAYSNKQRGAAHVWFGQVASSLNDAGKPLMTKPIFGGDDIETDWDAGLVKKLIFKPLLKVMFDKSSTEDQSTVEPTKVANTIIRHFSSKGVILPVWPSLR